METKSKYHVRLGALSKKPAFTVREARRLGVTKEALYYFEKKGVLQRVDRGVYRDPDYENQISLDLESVVSCALSIPNAVICLISALSYYEMTDEIPWQQWLAIPNGQRAPRRQFVRAIRMRNLDLGRTVAHIQGHDVAIFDRERCVVDAFRYLSIEVAIKALKEYLYSREYRPDMSKLYRYSRELKTDINSYVLALTT